MHLKYRFKNERETIGVNLAAVSILQKTIAEIENNNFAGLFNKPDAVANDPFHEWVQNLGTNLIKSLLFFVNHQKLLTK